jgi:hypothetical protein
LRETNDGYATAAYIEKHERLGALGGSIVLAAASPTKLRQYVHFTFSALSAILGAQSQYD